MAIPTKKKSQADFGYITAPNPSFNSLWEQGTKLQEMAKSEGVSSDPRIYANGWQYFYPGTDDQSNDDLPAWVMLAAPSLVAAGLPKSGAKVYLQLWVAEKQNFYCVAQVMQQVDNDVSLDEALK